MTQKCDLGVRYYPAVGLSLLVIPVSIYTPLWEVQIGVFGVYLGVSGTTPGYGHFEAILAGML